MTAKYVWNELKKLVTIDHDITAAKKEITQHTEAITAAEKPVNALKEQHTQALTTAKDLQKRLDALELDVADMRREDKKKQANLDTLIHANQIQALERELAELEDRIDTTETEMVTLLEQQEAAQHDAEKLTVEVDQATEKHAKNTAMTYEAIRIAQERIDALQAQWHTQADNVPAELSKNYMDVRSRVPNPVVPIISSSCSACFYGLLHQDVTAITKTTVIRCRGCYRFLFIPEDEAPCT